MTRIRNIAIEATAPNSFTIPDYATISRTATNQSPPAQNELARDNTDHSKQLATSNPQLLDWQIVFGNRHPVEIEVGFGKGLFLLTESERFPERNYFGIEIEKKYQLLAAFRLAQAGRKNVQVTCGDAKLILANHIPPTSVSVIHLYYPDPWWKQRHHKRRVFTKEFAQICAKILVPNGEFKIVTDVKDYYQMVLKIMQQLPIYRALPLPEIQNPQHDMDYLTHFERKFSKEKREIFRGCFQKIGLSKSE